MQRVRRTVVWPRVEAGRRQAAAWLAQERVRRYLPLAVFSACALAAVGLTGSWLLEVHGDLQDDWLPVDGRVSEWVRQHTPAATGPTLVLLSDLLARDRGLALVGIALLALVVYLLRSGHWRTAVGMFVATTVSSMGVTLAKLGFQRARPEVPWALAHETSYSFPSGHAAAAVVVYGMLAYVAWRLSRRWQVGVPAAVTALLLSVATGYSRIYLGVHYPTDVGAGFVVGLIWLVTGIVIAEALVLLYPHAVVAAAAAATEATEKVVHPHGPEAATGGSGGSRSG